MSEILSGEELAALVRRVFIPTDSDKALAVMVDLPDSAVADAEPWRVRREMAAGWVEQLKGVKDKTALEADLVLYRNPRMNNADLPETAWIHPGGALPASADDLDPDRAVPFAEVFRSHSILMAPTQFSATAPLKLMAKEYRFRAATMPGFSAGMIPALRLDYGEINRRVAFMKDLLDRAQSAELVFLVDGDRRHKLTLDLRYRQATASGGLFPEPGLAGNLPSGETYIVPYEGERDGELSRSAGELPVQFGDDLVVYRIVNNRAVGVDGEGTSAGTEKERLKTEPAYGNMAELGLGVLADFGVEPTGEILLDEKLALHIAFGRSDHFGGQVGSAQFSEPEAVVHIDRVYLPGIQPRIQVLSVDLTMPEGNVELMRDGAYVVDFK
jgi:hypothetical protein